MVWLRLRSASEVENYFIVYSFVLFFETQKIIYYSYVFKEAKLAKFIRYEALWKLYIFYHKVLGDVVKWWRFWGLWETLEIVKTWSWNILLFEEILHYTALHSEWHGSVFYSRLGFWIIFETQRLFIIPIFLRKQSWRNSFALKLCRNCIFSITKFSEMWWNDDVFERTKEHWKLWRCEVEIFFFMKRFFTMLRFVQNDTVLFFTHD